MSRWRKKPIVVEAFQWTADSEQEEDPVWIVEALRSGKARIHSVGPTCYMTIQTLEGEMVAQRCDWIIRGVSGEIYPCKPDIFEATYEPVEGE